MYISGVRLRVITTLTSQWLKVNACMSLSTSQSCVERPPLGPLRPALVRGLVHVPWARTRSHIRRQGAWEMWSHWAPRKRRRRTQWGVPQSATKHLLIFGVSSSVHFLIMILLPFFFGLSPYPRLYILISIYFLYILESTGSLLILSIANISSNLPDHFGCSLSSISSLLFYVTQFINI